MSKNCVICGSDSMLTEEMGNVLCHKHYGEFMPLAKALADPDRTRGYRTILELKRALLATEEEEWVVDEELSEMSASYKSLF